MWHRTGNRASAAGRVGLAVLMVALGLSACGDAPAPPSAPVADLGSVEAAFEACVQGDADAGLATLDGWLGRAPDDPDALVARGLCYWTRGSDAGDPADTRRAYDDLSDAIAAVEDGADTDTPLDQIYSHRAFVAQTLDDGWTRTLEDLGRAIEAAPREPGHVLDRGVVHAYAGDTVAARADLRRYLALADSAEAPDPNRRRVVEALLDDLDPSDL